MRTTISTIKKFGARIVPQSLRGRVLSITVSVIVLGLVMIILVLGGWIPRAPEDLSTRVDIAALLLGFLALVGILLAMLVGGLKMLFVNESRDVIHKFGLVSFGGAGAGDVYNLGDTTSNYPFQTSAKRLDVVSSDDEDRSRNNESLGGKGAHTVVIIGLNVEYEHRTEELDLNGTEAV